MPSIAGSSWKALMPPGSFNTTNPALLKPDTAWKAACQMASGGSYRK